MNVVWFAGWGAIVRTVVAGTATYLVLIVVLRISGPRTLAKWYAFDLIITVALGSTFANGVLSRDIAIAQAIAGFVLLVVLQFLVNPSPVLLLARGTMVEANMKHSRVTKADICKAVRSAGHGSLEQVAVVVLEPDGTFTVLGRAEEMASALEDVPGFAEAMAHAPRTTEQPLDSSR
jgi:uncharacterized membrane protein YcaP (DUF421 family)